MLRAALIVVTLVTSLAGSSARGAVQDPTSRFSASVTPIDATVAARITGHSWRAGCPVPLAQLRYVSLRHWGFDGRAHLGELVVNADASTTIVSAFRRLFAARFPIERMRLVDVYGADDDRSTKANNTSAFNCRAITGGRAWSQHSYGRAIDINPVQNPYVYRNGRVLDPAAVPYLDRSIVRRGMIVAGDAATAAFGSLRWGWGGNYRSFKDYQHFSATGG